MTQTTIKSKFPHPSFNPFQEEILDIIQKNLHRYKFFIVEAPPGIGKSAIARAFAEYFGQCDVLTHQLRLQQQYVTAYRFKSVSGRSHFNCLNNSFRCSRGECVISKNFKCDFTVTPEEPESEFSKKYFAANSNSRGSLYWKNLTDHCPYWQQKIDALRNGLVTHNYQYFLTESIFAGDFGGAKAMVCDECHGLEQIITDFVTVSLSQTLLEKIGQKLHNFKLVDEWISWLTTLSEIFIPRRIKEINQDLNFKFKNHNLVRERQDLENVKGKIDFFLTNFEQNKSGWLILPYMGKRQKLTKIEFKPLYANTFTTPFLFQNIEKAILMSATILDYRQFIKSIGLSQKDCLFIQVPSPFPVENRPIYKANVARLDAKSINPLNNDNTLDNLMSFIDITLNNPHFKNVKGIIHTTTYKMADYIKEHASTSPRMLFHSNSKEANEILEIHRNTDEPTVLVSPSMTEGVSLDDDLARFNIPLRVPYPNVGDPIIKARANIDWNWYYYMTALTLFQSIGRPVRNMNDYAVTIIPDSRLSYFMGKQFGYDKIPGWILDSMKSATELEQDYGLSYDFKKK